MVEVQEQQVLTKFSLSLG